VDPELRALLDRLIEDDAWRSGAPRNPPRGAPAEPRSSHFDTPEWDEFVAALHQGGQETVDHFGRNVWWTMGLAPKTAIRAAWGLARTGQAVQHGIKRVQAGNQGVPRWLYDAAYPARLRRLFRADPTKPPTPNFTDMTVLARLMEEVQRTRDGRRE
jgi:hypothetical protein